MHNQKNYHSGCCEIPGSFSPFQLFTVSDLSCNTLRASSTGASAAETSEINSDDTIVAVVTAVSGQGSPGGVAVVRLSGKAAVKIVSKMFSQGKKIGNFCSKAETWDLESHRVQYGWLFDPCDGNLPLDEVLIPPGIGRLLLWTNVG